MTSTSKPPRLLHFRVSHYNEKVRWALDYKGWPHLQEAQMSEIGPGGYLVGNRFGVADLLAAAVMTAIVRPPEFPYPLPEPWPPELVGLRASVAQRQGFRWVLDIYARHRGTSFETRVPVGA